MVNLVSLGQKNLKYYGSELIITPPDGGYWSTKNKEAHGFDWIAKLVEIQNIRIFLQSIFFFCQKISGIGNGMMSQR